MTCTCTNIKITQFYFSIQNGNICFKIKSLNVIFDHFVVILYMYKLFCILVFPANKLSTAAFYKHTNQFQDNVCIQENFDFLYKGSFKFQLNYFRKVIKTEPTDKQVHVHWLDKKLCIVIKKIFEV